jgi:hypothetical protein
MAGNDLLIAGAGNGALSCSIPWITALFSECHHVAGEESAEMFTEELSPHQLRISIALDGG